jgi:hypothetical protein
MASGTIIQLDGLDVEVENDGVGRDAKARRIRDSNPCYRRTPKPSQAPVAGVRILPVTS